MTLGWIIGGAIAVYIVALFLPFDWWRIAPIRQPDTFIGRILGGRMRISLRSLTIRVSFIVLMSVVLFNFLFVLPVLVLMVMGIFAVRTAFLCLRGSRTGLREFFVVSFALVFMAAFLIGTTAPARLLSMVPYFLLSRPAGGTIEALVVGTAMHTSDLVIAGCGLGSVGLWLLVDAVWRFRQASQVRNLPRSSSRALAAGLVELRGTVRPSLEHGKSPVVELVWDMFDYLQPKQHCEPFYLEDEWGRVLVDPRECRVRAGWITDLLSIFGTREIVITRRVEYDDVDDRVSKTILPGDRVYVIGNAVINEDAPLDAKGAERLVVRPAKRSPWAFPALSRVTAGIGTRDRKTEKVFFMSDTGEVTARRRILTGFRTVLILGFVWVFASVVLIWSVYQPVRQTPPPESWRNASWRGPEPNPDPRVIDYTRNKRLFRFEDYVESLGPDSHEAIPALIEAMGYPDFRFKHKATAALLAMKPAAADGAPGAVDVFVGNLAYPDARLQQLTMIGLQRFGPAAAPAIPMLIRLLHVKATNTYAVPGAVIRLQAARTLGTIGPAAAEALPTLEELLGDVKIVSGEARHAIGRIRAAEP